MDKRIRLIHCLKETYFRLKDIHTLKVKGQKKTFHANRYEKKKNHPNTQKTGVAILISEKNRL